MVDSSEECSSSTSEIFAIQSGVPTNQKKLDALPVVAARQNFKSLNFDICVHVICLSFMLFLKRCQTYSYWPFEKLGHKFLLIVWLLSSFKLDGVYAFNKNSHLCKTVYFNNGAKWNCTLNSRSFLPLISTLDYLEDDNNRHISWIPEGQCIPIMVLTKNENQCLQLPGFAISENDLTTPTIRDPKRTSGYIDLNSAHSSSRASSYFSQLKEEKMDTAYKQSNLNSEMNDFLRTFHQTSPGTNNLTLFNENDKTKTKYLKTEHEERTPSQNMLKLYHEYCIIGAGPAGLQMAYFLKKAKRDYIIYERANISGSFFSTYPRHRNLISINKQFTGNTNPEFQLRHDWNSLISDNDSLLFKRFSKKFFPHADSLITYLNEYKRKLDLNVQYETDIGNIRKVSKSINRPHQLFLMEDQRNRSFSCRYLIVATGFWKPHNPSFEGSNLAHGYEDFDLDATKYEGKNVLILGRGNSAFETAEALYGHTNFVHMVSRSRARLAWNTHYVGDLRAVNNGLLDTYQLKSLDGLLEASVEDMTLERRKEKLFVNFPSDVRSRHDTKGVNHPNRTLARAKPINPSAEANPKLAGLAGLSEPNIRNEEKPMDNFSLREGYDYVIRCLGFTFDQSIFHNSSFFRKFGSNGKFPGIKDTYESRIMPDMYVAGALAHSLDYRKSSGGFIHGFRYTVRVLHRLLEWKNHDVAWPLSSHRIHNLLNVIIRRVNEASGPYQMFQTLADVIMLKDDGSGFDMLEEFPIALLPRLETLTGRSLSGRERIVVILMEYGADFSGPGKDTFRSDRATGDPLEAHRSNFLHPVLYYYDHLPTESDMMIKWGKLLLPKPRRIHHVLEDFLTSWTAQQIHILPLRRFFETVSSQDIRHRFASSCYGSSLTHSSLPVGCREKTSFSLPRLTFIPDNLRVS